MDKNQSFFSSPQASQFLQNQAQLRQLLQSPDTKKLLEMMQQGYGSKLQQAAQSAKQGDPSHLLEMVQQLMNDPEGAKAVENIQNRVSE